MHVISTRKTVSLYVKEHHHLYLIVKFESSYEIQKLSLVAIDVDRQMCVMSSEHTARQNHDARKVNKFFGNVAKVKCVGTIPTNLNCTYKELRQVLN